MYMLCVFVDAYLLMKCSDSYVMSIKSMYTCDLKWFFVCVVSFIALMGPDLMPYHPRGNSWLTEDRTKCSCYQ